MPEIVNLPVSYHASSRTWMDGAAAVQMILDQISPLNPAWQYKTDEEIQDEIDIKIQANNSEPQDWNSDPDGVAGALNNLKPPAFHGGFVVYSLGTEDQASRKITYTLHRYQVATATLVYQGGHWVVVKGVQTDVDPLTNPTYTIDGFWIHNPWPGPWGQAIPGVSVQNVWISYSEWIKTYQTANTFGASGSQWLNRYISVCDPDPLPAGELKHVQRKPHADGRELLSTGPAEHFLRVEVQGLNLLLDAEFRRAWKAGAPETLFLVQRLDEQDAFSYLIAWRVGEETAAVFNMDARFGLLREATAFVNPVRWPYLGREEIIKSLSQGSVEVLYTSSQLPRQRWRRKQLRLWAGSWHLHDALVWLPCWESRSPAFPFYVLFTADRPYYISTLDGTVYDRLHPFASANRFPHGGA